MCSVDFRIKILIHLHITALIPGEIAPDFSLDSVLDGKVESISLSSKKDKYIVLMFFSVDFMAM